MVYSPSKDSSLSVNDLSSEIRSVSVSNLDENEMSGVRFCPNSHDPSLSKDVCYKEEQTENEMGKIVKSKESKSLTDKEIARIKRNKRNSRRKDVCKSMPIFLEDDSAEKLEDRIKAIVLDTSASKSQDDTALFQSLPILDDVIEERISRGSNITDSEKIYHKLCRRTKSFILSPDETGKTLTVDIEKKTSPMTRKQSVGIERIKSRTESRSADLRYTRTSSLSREKSAKVQNTPKSRTSYSLLGTHKEWLDKSVNTSNISKSVPSLSDLSRGSSESKSENICASPKSKSGLSWSQLVGNLRSFDQENTTPQDRRVPKSKSVDQLDKPTKNSKGIPKDLKDIENKDNGARMLTSDLKSSLIKDSGAKRLLQNDLKSAQIKDNAKKNQVDLYSARKKDSSVKGSQVDLKGAHSQGCVSKGLQVNLKSVQNKDSVSKGQHVDLMSVLTKERNAKEFHGGPKTAKYKNEVVKRTYKNDKNIKCKDRCEKVGANGQTKICSDELVLRQCQIGSATVFGLVQIKNELVRI